jgi:mono/diheme cytochrome c family protein
MNRSGRTLWSLPILLMSVACSGERRSGAVSTDSSAVADTTSVTATDTGKVPDTAMASTRTDTANTPRDTVRSKPAPAPAPRPATRATARKPPAARPRRTDTTAAVAPPTSSAAPASSSDTATSASKGQDSSTAAQQTNASAPLRDAYHQAPLDTVSQQVYDGWKQFNLNCARCHGEDAQGTTIAPHLIVSLRPDGPINTKELFIQTVCAGRPTKGMPSWCALGMEIPTIETIYSYVKGRSDSKIHPGRPAVKSGG